MHFHSQMQCFQLGRSVYKTYFGDPKLAFGMIRWSRLAIISTLAIGDALSSVLIANRVFTRMAVLVLF